MQRTFPLGIVILLLTAIGLVVLYWNQWHQTALQAHAAATAQAEMMLQQREFQAVLTTEIASIKTEQLTAIAQLQETVQAEIQKAQATDTPIPQTDISQPTLVLSPPNPQDACKNTNSYPKIYRKYESTQNAEILSLPVPDLTSDAVEHKDEAAGQIELDLILAPCGVMDHIILRGHVPYGLTEMAIKAAKEIEFKPAINEGQPVPQMISVIYEFYECSDKVICTKATEDVK